MEYVMMKTRRQYDAENKALRARLGAAAGETRRMLNERVKRAEAEAGKLREENLAKAAELTKLVDKIERLESLLAQKEEAS